MDRMEHEQSYITTDDDNIKRLLRSLSIDDYDGGRQFMVEAVQVLNGSVRTNYEECYKVDNDEIIVYEMTEKLMLVLNPTRSDYLKEIIHEQEDVKEKLQKMGYQSKTVLKKSDKAKNKTLLKQQFKPRKTMSATTRNRLRRNAVWAPEILRNLRAGAHGGIQNIPAVLII